MDSALPTTPKKEASWFKTARSSIKSFLSPERSSIGDVNDNPIRRIRFRTPVKSSIGDENASPIRRRKSISRLYKTLRSPSKIAHMNVVRRKSFSDIVYEATLRHRASTKNLSVSTNPDLEREPQPPYEPKPKACCRCTERPKTPDEYLRELIHAAETIYLRDSLEHPQCDAVLSDNTNVFAYGAQPRLHPLQNTAEATLFISDERSKDIDPGYRERADLRAHKYQLVEDLVSRSLGSPTWEIIILGADILGKPKPFKPLPDTPSGRPDLHGLYLEQSIKLRTPSENSSNLQETRELLFWNSDNILEELKVCEAVCSNLIQQGRDSSPRKLRRETRKLLYPDSENRPLEPDTADNNLHSIVEGSFRGRNFRTGRSNNSSEAELSADEIDLEWESDSVRSYESFKLPPDLIRGRSTRFFEHAPSEYGEGTKPTADARQTRENIANFKDSLKATAAESFRWKTQPHHCKAISAIESLVILENCMEVIAAGDARSNLEECHKILATAGYGCDIPMGQKKTSYGSGVSYLETESTQSCEESISTIAYLGGFKFSTYGHLLEDLPDESILDRSSLLDTKSLNRSTASNGSELGLAETQCGDNDSTVSNRVGFKFTTHGDLFEDLTNERILNHSTPSGTTSLKTSTTSNNLGQGLVETQSCLENITSVSELVGFEISPYGDLFDDMPDETIVNRSIMSNDSGIGLLELSECESLDRSTASSDSSERLDTTINNRSDALKDLFEDLNITPVNKVASLPQGGVRALVHVFESRGLMPDFPTRSITHVGSMTRIKTPERSYIDFPTFESSLDNGNQSGRLSDSVDGRSSRMSSYDTDESIGFGTPLKRYRRPVFEGMRDDD